MSETTTCPHCQADLRDGEYFRTLGITIRDIYDGVLFWACPDCHGTCNRWPLHHFRRHQQAEAYRAQYETRYRLKEPQ